MKQLTVDLGDRSYPIYIGPGLLNQAADLFKQHGIGVKSPILVVTDSQVAPHYLEKLLGVLREGGYKVTSSVVEAGEKSKSLAMLEQLVTDALETGLDRSSTIVALGGGVVGDLAGYAAASYMRGIRFVQMPTTILAHDSSVGGKVAVNHPQAKNIIGAFHQPEFVLYDISTLSSLPDREVRAGLSEMIKHGLIWERSFVTWCEENAEALLQLRAEALEYGLYEGCKVKAIVVSQDEREGGLRAILNLGHTFGHAFEAVAGYGELLHGEAIAIGMVCAARLSVNLGNPAHIYTDTERIFRKFGLPVRIPAHMDTEAIMDVMMHDKKFREGSMVFVVPTEIGKVEINDKIASQSVRDVLEAMKGEA